MSSLTEAPAAARPPDVEAVLVQARELLTDTGCMILRVPVVGGEAWETYRENWVRLDPPRHLYLHSLGSLHRLAAQAGLQIAELHFDSTALQFWGSELCGRDVPLLDPRSPAVNRADGIFSPAEMRRFEERSRLANRAGRGDQIAARLVRAA